MYRYVHTCTCTILEWTPCLVKLFEVDFSVSIEVKHLEGYLEIVHWSYRQTAQFIHVYTCTYILLTILIHVQLYSIMYVRMCIHVHTCKCMCTCMCINVKTNLYFPLHPSLSISLLPSSTLSLSLPPFSFSSLFLSFPLSLTHFLSYTMLHNILHPCPSLSHAHTSFLLSFTIFLSLLSSFPLFSLSISSSYSSSLPLFLPSL